MATVFFGMSVAFAVLTILVARQLSTPSESRYLFNIARAEFARPVQYVVIGWNFMIVAITLWLIISFFNLSAADECSSDTHSQECRWYPELFIALICGVNVMSFHAMNNALKVRLNLDCHALLGVMALSSCSFRVLILS